MSQYQDDSDDISRVSLFNNMRNFNFCLTIFIKMFDFILLICLIFKYNLYKI